MSDPSADDVASPRWGKGIGRSGVPSRQCLGRSVIRREHDGTDERGNEFRKGDPVLNEDNARTYRPCQAWAANGTEYCGNHGGSAPQTIQAAKRTLALAAENVARMLTDLAADVTVAPETRVKAGAQVLDRIGIRLGVDVSLEVPKWQKLIGDMFGAEAEPDEPSGGTPSEPVPVAIPAKKPRLKAAPSKDKPKFQGWA